MDIESMGPRIEALGIKGYRSIDELIRIRFPKTDPLVIFGENNAGKSNILRALDLIFGESWPGNYKPEDHEFFGRLAEGNAIKIYAKVSGLACSKCDGTVQELHWKYDPDAEKVCEFYCVATCDHTYVTNEVRRDLFAMTVGVRRDLSWQLSYNSKWTTLSKLMRRFHDRLVSDPVRVERLKVEYATLVSIFQEVSEFADFSSGLRSAVEDFGGNLRYGLEVDFSAYDASNYFRSLRVFPHFNGEPRTYEELGTGQEQLLAMAFGYAYAAAFGGGGLILVLEEPEAHLHPLAQQWLARQLRRVASAGAQVLVTTHSPYFLDISKPGTNVLVRKGGEDAATRVVQLPPADLAAKVVAAGAPSTKVTTATIGTYYESGSTYETLGGFFCRACVLVEGPTESFALPVLLERAGLDLLAHGIAVVPVEGVTNLAKWVRLYRAYEIPVYAIFDSDSDQASARELAANVQADILMALGVEPGEPELSVPISVKATHAVVDPNFEGAMRYLFPNEYERLDAEGVAQVGRAKQLRARWIARNLPNPTADPSAWKWLCELAEAVAALVPPAAASNTPASGATPPQPPPHGLVSRRAAPPRS